MVANIFKKYHILLLTFFIAVLASCNNGCNDNKLKVNVETVDVKIEFQRFDEEMFKCNTLEDIISLRNKYTNFYDDYVFNVMNFKPTKEDTLCYGVMLKMVKDKDILSLYDSTLKVIPDDKFIRDELTNAIKHYKYYFKDDSIPKFITFLSVISFPNTLGEGYVGIGLDMYLGKNFPYYYDSRLNFAQYFINYLNKDYLVRNTVKSFITSKFDEDPSPVFIERAVQQGRLYYLLDATCPEMPDTIKLQYSLEKLNWIKGVEKEMWVDLVNRKVLYSKNRSDNDKYFTPGPFTNAPNVSQDSPPRVGEWLGWQIVKKYMETHPDITIPQLMKEKDLLKIFKESGYRPK